MSFKAHILIYMYILVVVFEGSGCCLAHSYTLSSSPASVEVEYANGSGVGGGDGGGGAAAASGLLSIHTELHCTPVRQVRTSTHTFYSLGELSFDDVTGLSLLSLSYALAQA